MLFHKPGYGLLFNGDDKYINKRPLLYKHGSLRSNSSPHLIFQNLDRKYRFNGKLYTFLVGPQGKFKLGMLANRVK